MISVLIVGQSVPYMWYRIRPVIATRASSSRGLAVADAEMPLPNNAADDDLESDAGFVRKRRENVCF